jgi:hypothetical protein
MKISRLGLLVSAALLLAACRVPAKPDTAESRPILTVETETIEPPASAEIAPRSVDLISVKKLVNATCSGNFEEPITLVEGKYEGQPYVDEFPDRPTVQNRDGSELYGDLGRDGVEDGVLFLVERGGGTAVITYIAALLKRNGEPVDAGALRMDEVSVRSGFIENGRALLEIITAGPDDGDCCQSHKARRTHALQDGTLVEESSEAGDLERVSATDLSGTNWSLLGLNRNEPVLDDVDVTVKFAD